jgi:hypothetical protein
MLMTRRVPISMSTSHLPQARITPKPRIQILGYGMRLEAARLAHAVNVALQCSLQLDNDTVAV